MDSMVELEKPVPERSGGVKRVKAPPKNPSLHNRNTRNRACRGVGVRVGAHGHRPATASTRTKRDRAVRRSGG